MGRGLNKRHIGNWGFSSSSRCKTSFFRLSNMIASFLFSTSGLFLYIHSSLFPNISVLLLSLPFQLLTTHPSIYRPRPPKTPHPLKTSLSPQNSQLPSSPSPYLPKPSLLPLSPSSPHLMSRFPSSTPLAPVPASHPPSAVASPPVLNARGFKEHGESSVLAR
jgi:hypothetical protein